MHQSAAVSARQVNHQAIRLRAGLLKPLCAATNEKSNKVQQCQQGSFISKSCG
jgi:hypothetical protein